MSNDVPNDIPVEGDFRLEPLDDKVSCKAIRYIGYEEDVEVPGTLRDLAVTGLYQTFSDCSLVESVVLPESIVSLENMCFWKCIRLKHVELREGLKTIGQCSFGDAFPWKILIFRTAWKRLGTWSLSAASA